MRPPARVVMGLAVVLALILVAVLFFQLGSADRPAATAQPSPSPSAGRPPTTAEIYAALAPSVVTVEANGTTGTGVVANAEGIVITALSVVGAAGPMSVTFADGTVASASLLASDAALGIAALTVSSLPAVVVPAIIGNSDRLAVGDAVLAIGNQVGMTGSATTGVVSGLDRRYTAGDGRAYTGLIQFDAAVNAGSFGGPLVNMRGETVGIVVALSNPTAAGTFIGLGFAVPIGAAVAAGGPGPQQ